MNDKHYLRRLLDRVERELNWKPMKPFALQKAKRYLHGIETPKKETLDKLSLFIGFQDWDSFKATLNGETDGQVNFKQPKNKEKADNKEETVSK